jgi:hypothetical protein
VQRRSFSGREAGVPSEHPQTPAHVGEAEASPCLASDPGSSSDARVEFWRSSYVNGSQWVSGGADPA